MDSKGKQGAFDPDQIDDWSRRVYRALRNWPVAQQGQWSRWEPGYLLLRIEQVDGEAVEAIDFYTADEEVTVEFGGWHEHIANEGVPETDAERAAAEGKARIEGWLRGGTRTVVFTDANGKWCGTVPLEPGDAEAQVQAGAQWIRNSHPLTAELRSVHKRDWTTIAVKPEWVLPLTLSPERLP